MAFTSPNLTEIVTTTLRRRSKALADNISQHNALLSRMQSKGNSQLVPGGRTIVEELEYAENATFQYYSGYEVLDVSPSDVFTAAEYNWKQSAVNVTASGLETRIQNAGPEQIIALLESRIKNAEKTMANQTSVGIYSDGTGSNGKQIGGLQSIVADGGAGTVGGIDAGTYTWWGNQTSGDVAGIDSSAALLDAEMKNMWLETTRGTDGVDLIVSDQTLYKVFWDNMTDRQRITDASEGVQGFNSLKFVTADVVMEGGPNPANSGIPANHMYFLNTDYLKFKVHAETNFVPFERRQPVNQDALVVPILFAGNLCCSNRFLQGVVYT
tara:strand:- start:1241 stop:2218 length:978 start_codon:yes stop_codon:yes gene_type:complete